MQETPMTAPPTAPAPAAPESPFRSVHSLGLPALLERLGITLLVTTYQAGTLMAVRGDGGRIRTLPRSCERPPASTLCGVAALVGADWLIESEAVAMLTE